MKNALLPAALASLLAACSPDAPQAQRWDRAELVDYTYSTREGEVSSSFTFRADDSVDATYRKGDAVAGPLMFWTLDDQGVLYLGPTRNSRDMPWTKIEVRGDTVIIATRRGRQEFTKSKGK